MKPSDWIRRGWCHGVAAKNGNGIDCDARASDAVQFCAIGAILRAYDRDEDVDLVVNKLRDKVRNIPYWNDRPYRTQEDVVSQLMEIGE